MSGTFYPIENLPALLQPIAWLTPLYHGVALTRGLSLGTAGEQPLLMALHLGVLLAFTIGGALATIVMIQRRMVR